ncbi:hypothetical protein ABID97_003631 [Variovorax sp. OAS795]|uniref:hypothetical protein n=1 Tax=Variovorax sp. OAS795 TaxID=3034231 RepID=UPI00339455EC
MTVQSYTDSSAIFSAVVQDRTRCRLPTANQIEHAGAFVARIGFSELSAIDREVLPRLVHGRLESMMNLLSSRATVSLALSVSSVCLGLE